MDEKLISGWNALVTMESPTVAAVSKKLGGVSPTPVFKSGPQVQFFLRDNLVLFIAPLTLLTERTAVTSVGAIMQADVYPGNTLAGCPDFDL
jgi:hypothetical protein